MSETEQNKTEEPTDFKLKKAREKGQVAKGQDIAFFGLLVALGIYAIVAGPQTMRKLTMMMRRVFLSSIEGAEDPNLALTSIRLVYWPAVQTLALLGATLFVTVVLMQLIQLRGPIFTTHPLKPDFSKINPGKGLKRIFSMRTLKEAGKNIIKMSIYLGATYLLIMYCLRIYAPTLIDADGLVRALHGGGLRLLFMYTLLALFFTAIDQIIVRKEFTKQMRMSKSEVEREHKDREGEPRMKQKRKQLHAEYIKQTQGSGDLPGSDVLIVNPQHYAVALKYDAEKMIAPMVSTKGRNNFALSLKKKAFELSVPIVPQPKLARALYKYANSGEEIPAEFYQTVADIYLRLYRQKQSRRDNKADDNKGNGDANVSPKDADQSSNDETDTGHDLGED